MRCFHCGTDNPTNLPYDHPVDGGRAYKQVCVRCGRTVGIRARLAADPPVIPPDLDEVEIARLRFVQWRLHDDCVAQIVHMPGGRGHTSPLSAA